AALEGLEALHVDLQRVGVGRDVGENEIAVGSGEGGRQLGAARFARQGHGGAWHHASLRVLESTGQRSGGELRGGRNREQTCSDDEQRDRRDRRSVQENGILLPPVASLRRIQSGAEIDCRSAENDCEATKTLLSL